MAGNFDTTNEKHLEKQYPLHKACRDGDQETLISLLSLNQHDLYEEDGFYGWTPTHWASYYGKLSCLMKLTEHGLNCDSATVRFNQSPLHIAALGGNGHCIKWLLHCGASLNRQLACLRKVICEINLNFPCNYSSKGSGVTPVHVAALGGQPHCLLWLIQAGGNLGAKDYLGDTPLHKAARCGSMECISLLVAQNSALDIRNYNGQTASEVAANSSHIHCSEYLQKAIELHHNGHLQSSQFNIQSHNTPTMHNRHNNHADSMDCDMDIDTNNSNVHCDMSNGDLPMAGDNGTCIEMNGIPIDGRGDNVFRAFAGMKRSFDDDEEEHIKRRCFREHKVEETALNNNVISSYQSILAISSLPSNLSTNNNTEDYNPAYHINPKTSAQPAGSLPTESLSDSSIEHNLAIHEAQGYDSLLAASMIYHD